MGMDGCRKEKQNAKRSFFGLSLALSRTPHDSPTSKRLSTGLLRYLLLLYWLISHSYWRYITITLKV